MYFSITFDPLFLGEETRSSYAFPFLHETKVMGGILLGAENGTQPGPVLDFWTLWEGFTRLENAEEVQKESVVIQEIKAIRHKETLKLEESGKDFKGSKKLTPLPQSWISKSWFMELMTLSVAYIARKDGNKSVPSSIQVPDSYSDHVMKLEPPVLYTCQDFKKMMAFVVEYYQIVGKDEYESSSFSKIKSKSTLSNPSPSILHAPNQFSSSSSPPSTTIEEQLNIPLRKLSEWEKKLPSTLPNSKSIPVKPSPPKPSNISSFPPKSKIEPSRLEIFGGVVGSLVAVFAILWIMQ